MSVFETFLSEIFKIAEVLIKNLRTNISEAYGPWRSGPYFSKIEPFQVIKTEQIQNVPIQKTSLLSRFRKYDGGSQYFTKFSTSDRARSDPIGRKESPLQRKPRLNGLQNKTSPQSTLRIAFKYGPAKTENKNHF